MLPLDLHVRIVDRAMMADFVEAAQETRFADALIFALLTGVRIGELRGLRWSDIDYATGRITIERQIISGNRFAPIQTTKNGKARTFQLSQAALELLKKHRREQQIERMACGDKWIEDDVCAGLIFRKPNGDHYHQSTLREAIKKVGAAIGLEGMTAHDLRHSFAVAALRSGTDVKTVQHMLGHSSAAVTMNIYMHYTDDMGKSAADRMDAYWSDALGRG